MKIISIITVIVFLFRLSNSNYPDISTVRLIINGPIILFASEIDKNLLLYNVQFLQDMDIDSPRKLAVLQRILEGRNVEELSLDEMTKLGTFLQAVTSYDLHAKFNCSSLDHVYIFGKNNLPKRYLGILADCLRKNFGETVHQNYEYINRMTSILCGFGFTKLAEIEMNDFLLITGEVFSNLERCSRHQLQALYRTAVSPNVYGPPSSWDRSVIKTLGRLFTIAPLEDVTQIDKEVLRGLAAKFVKELSPEKIKLLNNLDMYFDLRTRREFWQIRGVSYRASLDIVGSILN